MMDLWAVVPYYTAYLSRALLRRSEPQGRLDHLLSRSRLLHFSRHPAHAGSSRRRRPSPPATLPRRLLKMAEAILNIGALCVRFAVSRPDIIHVQYLAMLRWPLPLDWWFVRFWQRRGVRVLLTVHDILPHDTATKFKELYREVYSVADAIICHSDHVSKRLSDEFGVAPSKISVIPHGPFFYDLPPSSTEDLNGTPQIPPGRPLFLWQGIIFPYKGIDILLERLASSRGGVPDARLVISGTGSPRNARSAPQQIHRLDLKHVQLDLRFISSKSWSRCTALPTSLSIPIARSPPAAHSPPAWRSENHRSQRPPRLPGAAQGWRECPPGRSPGCRPARLSAPSPRQGSRPEAIFR